MTPDSPPSSNRWKNLLEFGYKATIIAILSFTSCKIAQLCDALRCDSRSAVESVQALQKNVEQVSGEVRQTLGDAKQTNEAWQETHQHVQELAEKVNGVFPFTGPKQRPPATSEGH